MPIKNNQINLFILLVVFGTNFIFTKENKQFLYHYSIPQIFQELTMCKFSKGGKKNHSQSNLFRIVHFHSPATIILSYIHFYIAIATINTQFCWFF